MAGYTTYCESEGTAVHRLYQYPFVVRCQYGERYQHLLETVSSHRTETEAQNWISRFGKGYTGIGGVLTVENWNLTSSPAAA